LIPNSLRFRLFGTAVIVILVAVQIGGVMLQLLFERNVLRLVHSELDANIEQLAQFLSRDESGRPQLMSELADAHFRKRFSGRYWQITGNGEALLRSRSLADAEIDTTAVPKLKGGVWRQPLIGPDKQQLYATVRRVVLEPVAPGQQATEYLLIAATDVAEIRALDALNGQLRGDVLAALGLLALLLIVAAGAQVQVGLRPLEVLRTGLESIRVGNARRLSDNVPAEVRPLVNETNRLLEAQEKVIEVARARAGDLAHGLKTPLTAMSVLAGRLREEHKTDIAGELDQYLKGLRRHVERELTTTRIAASTTMIQRTSVAPIVGRLFRTMEKLPRGDQIDWNMDCKPELVAPVEEADLAELLGNLLDNARKWARSEVRITARSLSDNVELTIEDDGPGVPEGDREAIFEPFRQGPGSSSSHSPGTGIGLSLVGRFATLHGGRAWVEEREGGGASFRVYLPDGARGASDGSASHPSRGPSSVGHAEAG
jgi:signal transduction histidine kinase